MDDSLALPVVSSKPSGKNIGRHCGYRQRCSIHYYRDAPKQGKMKVHLLRRVGVSNCTYGNIEDD